MKILDEIKQTRPFRTKSQEATVALLRTAHLVRRRVEALVGTEGLTSQQYNVLRILRGAKTPLPVMEIADRMIEPACGITRLIAALEEKDFLRREQWPGDRRQFLCQITPSGMRALERLDGPVDRLDEITAESISSEELDTLIDVLSRIRENTETKE